MPNYTYNLRKFSSNRKHIESKLISALTGTHETPEEERSHFFLPVRDGGLKISLPETDWKK